jgi:hypothetical protein
MAMRGRDTALMWLGGGLLAAVAAGLSNASPSLRPAHHGGGEPPAVADHVTYLVEMADEACFVRGSDADALAAWARFQHWTPATAEALGAGANGFATLLAGWTYETQFAAFAIVQSRLNPPHDGHVCSLTTRLLSGEQHGEVRSAFEKKFGAPAASEPERDESHTDQFWIERDLGPPVKATIVHTPATRSITIRMIHGKAWPLRSRAGAGVLVDSRSKGSQ